jgi:hypothetical protein
VDTLLGVFRSSVQSMPLSFFISIFILTSSISSSWLSSRLDKFDLIVHDFASTGRGLRTLRPRFPGDVVISVPEIDAVTVTSLLDRFPDVLGRAATKQTDKKLSDEQVMAMGLLLLRDEGNQYALSLPERQYSVLDIPHAILHCMPRAYQNVILAYQNHVSELHVSLNDVLDSKVSLDDFRWAFATVRSRCVGVGDEVDTRVMASGQKRVMLPAFDILNHKFGAKAVLLHSLEDHSYVLRSNDAFGEGEQVYISYGETRDNLKMLMTYGFCVPRNPNALVFFDVQDLLHACSLARPAYFPEPVQQAMHGLMKKLGKERDLYEFDGSCHKPSRSLQVGLEMMADIEKQFLEEPDHSFAREVLKALVYARIQEVGDRLMMVNQIHDDIEVGWRPFIDSIRTLLWSELEFL